LKSADLAGVDDPARPVGLAGSVEAAQQLAVQARHTPSGRQSRSRRQAVTPAQPISMGTMRHGTPVTRTKTIAVNAARSLTRGRPVRCAARSGDKRSSTSQNRRRV
jgi:hypothetical protein